MPTHTGIFQSVPSDVEIRDITFTPVDGTESVLTVSFVEPDGRRRSIAMRVDLSKDWRLVVQNKVDSVFLAGS